MDKNTDSSKMPAFSVIMPTYNRAFCIKNAINSLLKQTYQKFELIIVDDGSADGTEQIVNRAYRKEILSKKIKYIKLDHKGVCAARNVGIKAAANNWITYLDTDNVLLSNALGVYAHSIIDNPKQQNFYARFVSKTTKEVYGNLFSIEDMKKQNMIDLGIYVHHKSLLEKCGMFDESLTRLVDWDFIARQCFVSMPKFIDDIVMVYNNDVAFKRITTSEDYQKNFVKVHDKLSNLTKAQSVSHKQIDEKTSTDKKTNIAKKEIKQIKNNVVKVATIKRPTIDHFQNEQVTIAMTTYPKRGNSYLNTMWQLLAQCDRLCICFNGYDEIPKELPNLRKIVAICANGKNGNPPDLGCNNKMYWIGKYDGYYAPVDDDIIYPLNYINTLKAVLKKYNNQIITSFHGHIYGIQDGKIQFSTRKLICYDTQHDDVWCHRLGMGVSMFHPKTIGIKSDVFMNSPKNTGDDELMAIWAQKNEIPMLCASTKNLFIFSQLRLALETGLCTNRTSMANRRKLLESYQSWKLNLPNNNTMQSENKTQINTEDDVTVAMATQPHRKEQMLKVVKALLPQCTRICIALNEYDSVPTELLNNNKIITILTGKKTPIKDLGNLNKMLWCGMYPGYYATVDDDLDYFPGYIDKLKSSLKKYDNKAICSFHGLKYDIQNGQIIPNTKSILFYNKIIEKDEVCLRPGMGTAMFHPHTLKINKAIYLRHEKGTSDDCLTSIWAQQHNIPCIVVGRDKIYMDATKFAYDGIYRDPNVQIARTKLMMSYTNWKYIKI